MVFMETKQDTVQVRTESSVNVFCVLVIIGLAYASGYMCARSVIFNPAGWWTVAQVRLGGLAVSVVLIFLALGLIGKVVKVSKKFNR